MPFFAAIATSTLEDKSEPEVTLLEPAAKERVHAGGTHATASTPVASRAETAGEAAQPVTAGPRKKHARKRRGKDKDPLSLTDAIGGKW
ncbi:MAG: hypothetical protein WDN31_04790 [Hyphomicrobium sp.]